MRTKKQIIEKLNELKQLRKIVQYHMEKAFADDLECYQEMKEEVISYEGQILAIEYVLGNYNI